jgi:hypothetical protein
METSMNTNESVALIPIETHELLRSAVEHGASVEALERLVALARDVRADRAREAWHTAMAEFQRLCPPIMKSSQADFNSSAGRVKYRWAPLDGILRVVHPVLGPLGLSLAWTTRIHDGAAIANCRISHAMGHHEDSGELPIPLSAADKTAANAAQRVGIAITYARRYSLLAVLGLAPEDDPDAQGVGEEPKAEVKQPQRKSETTGEHTAESAPQDGEWMQNAVVTLVGKPSHGTNKGNGKKWSRWPIETTGGSYQTFSETVADLAATYAKSKEGVVLTIQRRGQYENVTGIEAQAAADGQ